MIYTGTIPSRMFKTKQNKTKQNKTKKEQQQQQHQKRIKPFSSRSRMFKTKQNKTKQNKKRTKEETNKQKKKRISFFIINLEKKKLFCFTKSKTCIFSLLHENMSVLIEIYLTLRYLFLQTNHIHADHFLHKKRK